jgi:hypothetical protein
MIWVINQDQIERIIVGVVAVNVVQIKPLAQFIEKPRRANAPACLKPCNVMRLQSAKSRVIRSMARLYLSRSCSAL